MSAKPRSAVLRCGLAALALVLALSCPVRAVTPDEMLTDPALEARARGISQKLRCVVCQNQSIDDSNAPLAHDLRILVRERLTAGDTDAQATRFMVERYGNFVLLRPPFQLDTLILWFGPAVLLIIAGLGLRRYLLGQSSMPASQAAASFTPDEQERLDALVKSGRPR
jgi:cytochrome c-type biogenesis protein CcmH